MMDQRSTQGWQTQESKYYMKVERPHQKAYNDDEIIRILAIRSKALLLATFNHYTDAFGHPIMKDLKADPKDRHLKMLRGSVTTTRAEVDLKLTREAYQEASEFWCLTARGKLGS
ncbi:unnamed protein product [Urochloa humidicola]